MIEQPNSADAKPNREYKSGVFADLIGVREAALEIYYALKNVKLPEDTPVEVITLHDVLYMGQINDCAFLIGNVIILLLEHQSSINPNMPIRVLIYLGREYEKIIRPYKRKLYLSQLVPLPRPEFYVLYNGKKHLKDDNGNDTDYRTYKLSDAFIAAPQGDTAFKGYVELEVPVYDINLGHNIEILERSSLLKNYATLIAKIREFESAGNGLLQAINQAVDYCIDNDILRKYLEDRASEVLSLLFEELTVEDLLEEQLQEGIEKGERIGIEKGERIGIEKGKLEDAFKMLEDGVVIENILKWTGLDISVVEKAINESSLPH